MKPENLKCPTCNGPMVSRVTKKPGRSEGQRFWGCARFPQCRGTRDTDGLSFEERRQSRRRESDDDDVE